VVRDLRANISAEAGARQTHESLIKACDDEGTKKTLHHLLTREITHANMFMKRSISCANWTIRSSETSRRNGQAGVQSGTGNSGR
jgi:Mn-containing catalase